MQKPAAAFELIPGRRRIELLELSLQLLVYKQQGFQRSANIAIACCHDPVDDRLAWIGIHCKSSECSL